MKLKVGDKVKIKDNLKDIEDFAGAYVGALEDYVGNECVVRHVRGRRVILEGNSFTWDIRALEKIQPIEVGDKVRINKQVTIEDLTKNYWNHCQISTLNFIEKYADKDITFTVKVVNDDYLKLEEEPSLVANINIFELVEKQKKKMTVSEICKELGYDVEIVKE